MLTKPTEYITHYSGVFNDGIPHCEQREQKISAWSHEAFAEYIALALSSGIVECHESRDEYDDLTLEPGVEGATRGERQC